MNADLLGVSNVPTGYANHTSSSHVSQIFYQCILVILPDAYRILSDISDDPAYLLHSRLTTDFGRSGNRSFCITPEVKRGFLSPTSGAVAHASISVWVGGPGVGPWWKRYRAQAGSGPVPLL